MFGLSPLADAALRGLILTICAIAWVILLVRVVGLRSFSKMTAFDFVTTIGVGSLIAQTGMSTSTAQFLQSLAAIATMFAVQWSLARLRLRSAFFASLIRNNPVFLVRNGQLDEEALHRTRVSKNNVYEKLRMANVKSLSDVSAVVLETTGDISVIQGEVDEDLLCGIEQAGRR